MIGRVLDLVTGRNGKQRLTIELDGDFSATYAQLEGIDRLDVEIKKHRKRRSKDANAYAWILIDKIANALQTDKTVVYRQAIREIGGVSDTICVKNEAVDQLRRGWSHNGMGWSSDTLPSKIEGCTNIVLYYGSSTFDTKQMSNLIEHLIYEAKSLGIETLTPAELERMVGFTK